MQGSGTNSGSHQFSVSERSASAHSASSAAMARASAPSAARGPAAGRAALVEPLLARQGALLRAQGLVFKGLQLGRDEALGVLERLAAAVVVGHLVDLALRDFDVEAVHLVELHAQVGNAGAGALAGFQVEQEAVAVGLDGAQLVQLGVKAVVDDATVAHQRGRFGQQGAVQQHGAAFGRLQVRPAGPARARQRPQCWAPGCAVAWQAQRQASAFSSVWPRPTSSRGRTWRSAMRAVMRSTSPRP
jgi:hypothetical protein